MKLSNTSIKTPYGTVKQFEDKFQVLPAAHYQNYHKAKGWVIQPLDGCPKVLKDSLNYGKHSDVAHCLPDLKAVKHYIASLLTDKHISDLIDEIKCY